MGKENTMRFKRVTALFLSVAMLCTSFDFGGLMATAHAEDNLSEAEIAALMEDSEARAQFETTDLSDGIDIYADSEAFKFVESNFDADESVMTMDLWVKPDYTDETKQTLAEGAFLFSYDMNTLSLQTNPSAYNEAKGTSYSVEKLDDRDGMAVVGGVGSASIMNDFVAASGEDDPAERDDDDKLGVDGEQKGVRVYTNSNVQFSQAMSAYEYINYGNPVMYTDYDHGDFGMGTTTGLIVSTSRARNSAIGSSDNGMADVYFQFKYYQVGYAAHYKYNPKDGDNGYVKVASFDFSILTGGYNEEGELELAHSQEGLFKNSIVVPEDAAEANRLLSQYYFMKETYTSQGSEIERVDMAMGAAGIKVSTAVGANPVTITHYYDRPTATKWSKEWNGNENRTSWDTAQKYNALSGTPHVEYTNCEREYKVEGFYARHGNTFEGVNADFPVPSGEAGDALYARYQIPLYDTELQNDADGNWVPERYVGSRSTAEVKKMPYSYNMGTTVTANSATDPESENLDKFLSDIDWNLSFTEAGMPISDILNYGGEYGKYIETFEEVEDRIVIQTAEGPATAQKLVITGPEDMSNGTSAIKNPYLGKTFQKYTYDNPDDVGANWEYSPVGITVDMIDSTMLLTNWLDEEEEVTVKAPQLNIKSYAADKDSMIWVENPTNLGYLTGYGYLYMTADYTDTVVGKTYRALPVMKTRLYKEAFKGTRIEIDLARMSNVPDDEGATMKGFELSKNVDSLATQMGTRFQIFVFDQYGMVFNDTASKRTYTLEKVGDSTASDKLPMVIKQVGTTVDHYIDYADSKIFPGRKLTINDVERGEYVIHATIGTITTTPDTLESRSFFINKEANVLTGIEMDSPIITDPDSQGYYSDRYMIPPFEQGKTAVRKDKIEVSIKELSNQYRNLDDPFQMYQDYDVARTIRNQQKKQKQAVGSNGKPLFDEFGNPIYQYDSSGNPVYETDASGNPVYLTDDDGNPVYENKVAFHKAEDAGVTIKATIELQNPATMSWEGISVNGMNLKSWFDNPENADYKNLPFDITATNISSTDYDNAELFLEYTTKTRNNTVLLYKVSAEYEGVTLTKQFKFTLYRDPSYLNVMTNNVQSLEIIVPNKVSGADSLSRNITPIPYDQYGERSTWTTITGGGTQYVIKTSPVLPTDGSVTLQKSGSDTYLVVNSNAKEADYKVWAEYNAGYLIKTSEINVKLKREASLPSKIEKLVYPQSGTWEAPQATESAATYKPNVANGDVLIQDQYFERIGADLYSLNYELISSAGDLTISGENPGLELINSSDGTVRVNPKAGAGTARMRVHVYDSEGNRRFSTGQAGAYPDITLRVNRSYINTVQHITINETYTSQGTGYNLIFGRNTTLTSSGTNVYDDDITIAAGNVTWELKSVELRGGDIKTPTLTSGTYNVTGSTGLRIFSMNQTGGGILFPTTPVYNEVPVKATVIARTVGAGGNIVSDERTFAIVMDPASEPDRIFVDARFGNTAIGIPTSQDPTPKESETLAGTILDQYDITLPGKAPTWEYLGLEDLDGSLTQPNKDAVVFENGRLRVISSNAVGSVAILKASYDDLEPVIVRIEIEEKDAEAADVEILDLSSKIYLGELGNDRGTAVQFSGRLLSQFGRPMPSAGKLNWSVVSVTSLDGNQTFNSNSVVFADTKSSTARVYYDADIVAAGGAKVTIKAVSTEKWSETVNFPEATKTFTIELADARPVIAEPRFMAITPPDEGALDRGSDTSENASDPNTKYPWVWLPDKGNETTILVDGVVYDQYKREITAGSDSKVALSLIPQHANIRGLSLDYNNTTSQALATIRAAYDTDYALFTVKAVPKENPTSTASASVFSLNPEQSVFIMLSEVKASELVFGEVDNEIPDDYVYEFDVPLWETDPDAFVPTDKITGSPLPTDPETEYETNTTTYSLSAEILNQRGGVFPGSVVPVWELSDDYNGVDLLQKRGKISTTEINSKTLEADELRKRVEIDVSTDGDASIKDREELNKTALVDIVKAPSKARYMYIAGSDETGKTEPLMRPTVAEKTRTKTIEPIIYDQYGFRVSGVDTTVYLDADELEALGAVVEIEYEKVPPGQEEEVIPEPLSYTIYDSELYETENDKSKAIIGKYVISTKELTIHNGFTLKELGFVAKVNDPSLLIASKELTVPVAQQASRPSGLKLSSGDNRAFTFKNGQVEEMEEYVTTTMYDQFGEVINPSNYSVAWSLKTRNSDGTYSPYVETIKDSTGAEVPITDPNERLVSIIRSGTEPNQLARYNRIVVRPENYQKDVELYLEAEIVNQSGRPTDPPIKVYTKIQVKMDRGGPGPPIDPPLPQYLQVTYSPGEHGRLVGDALEIVLAGDTVKKAPGLKTEKGWAFDKWSVDGEKINAKEYSVNDNVNFVATYKDISQRAFVDGYSDGTVRTTKGVTRAEFIKMLVLAVGDYDPDMDYIPIYGDKFIDVPSDKWHANYIAYGRKMGIVDGYEDGTFRPDKEIQRAEAAKLIYQAIPELVNSPEASGEYDIDEIFSDIKEKDWFAKQVEALYYLDIIGGYNDGTFKPTKVLTRAEAIKMIVLIAETAPSEEELEFIKTYADSPFTDLTKNSWVYAYLLRAAGIA